MHETYKLLFMELEGGLPRFSNSWNFVRKSRETVLERRDTLILLAARPERFHRLDSQALLVIADRYVALDIGNIAGIP